MKNKILEKLNEMPWHECDDSDVMFTEHVIGYNDKFWFIIYKAKYNPNSNNGKKFPNYISEPIVIINLPNEKPDFGVTFEKLINLIEFDDNITLLSSTEYKKTNLNLNKKFKNSEKYRE